MTEATRTPEPEQELVSSTEASNRWEVNYNPSLKHVLAATLGSIASFALWHFGQTDLETAKIIMAQGVYSEAVVKGLLGAAESIAGVTGGAAGVGWAWRESNKQLDHNPKPK